MPGALFQYEAVFPYQSGAPRDVAINVFHLYAVEALVAAPADLATALAEVPAKIVDFYNGVHSPGTSSIASQMSTWIDRPRARVDMSFISSAWATPNGHPTFTPQSSTGFTLNSTSSATALPLEVAVVGSLVGTAGVDTDVTFPPEIRRRRGRIYIGPLSTLALTSTTTTPPVVQAPLRADIASACHTFSEFFAPAVAGGSSGGLVWVCWSRVAGGLSWISEGHVNDEWDTQRRRGGSELVRTIWP